MVSRLTDGRMSIPIIWSLANYTNILTNDPALWFAMMLMPVGPPAMKLLALADVNDVDEEITMSIARLLTVSVPGSGSWHSVINWCGRLHMLSRP